jgi:hypothetical protein
MRIAGFLTTCVFLIAFHAVPALGASTLLTPMDDAELDDVRGQSGIALAISDLKLYLFDDGIAFEDTEDNNRIHLNGIMVSINRFTTHLPFTMRVYQNQWDYAMIGLEAIRYDWLDMAPLEMNLDLYVTNFAFYDATADTLSELGSLYVAGFSPSEFALYVAPISSIQHEPTSGVGFQVETRLEIEEFRWVYNEDADELRFAGIHLAGSFDPSGDDYTDPDTWTPEGRFAIGSIDPRDEESAPFNPAPAAFHVVKDESHPNEWAMLRIQLPETRGSVRIAETEMGGANFGPVIIDGFRAHHLQVDLVPW